MRHNTTAFIICLVFMISLALPIGAQEEMDHGDMSHGSHDGELIRETTVKGYGLSYRLIDMQARMKDMADMPEMDATHHLMLYIHPPAGKSIESPKVGFLVEGPNGKPQKAMAMAMAGGFGADLDLSEKGDYTIKSKAVFAEVKLIDGFEYTIE
ncbi:MAG: hypothetical protein ACLFRF_04950 [Desulfobacterales bacterium]